MPRPSPNRDKASDQEKHDSPVEVEPPSSDQSADGERTQVTNLADVAPDEPDGQIGQIISAGSEGETVAAAGSESEPSKVRAAPVFEPPVAEARETEAETRSDGDSAPAARAENLSGTRAETTTSGRAEATTSATSVTTMPAPSETTAPADTTAPPAPARPWTRRRTAQPARRAGISWMRRPRAPQAGERNHRPLHTSRSPGSSLSPTRRAAWARPPPRSTWAPPWPRSASGCWSSTSIPQGNATTGLGIDARNFERSMYDVLMRDDPLEDCIEPTSMKNLFVAPATIDLAGAEIELVPAFSRELKLRAGPRVGHRRLRLHPDRLPAVARA